MAALKPALAAVADAPPDSPVEGTFARSDDGRYRGWWRCTRCGNVSRIVGDKRTAAESPTGEFIELTITGHGRTDTGELRGKHVRGTSPCCRAYNQLAVEIDRTGAVPVAVLLKPARGGA